MSSLLLGDSLPKKGEAGVRRPPPSLSPLSSSGSGRRAKERQEGKEGKKEGMKEGKKKRQLYCVHRREKQPKRGRRGRRGRRARRRA